MPKNKVQGLVFGILMSVTMAYGVEVYNVANKEGGLAQMTMVYFGMPYWKLVICGCLFSFSPTCGATAWDAGYQAESAGKKTAHFCRSCLYRVVPF